MLAKRLVSLAALALAFPLNVPAVGLPAQTLPNAKTIRYLMEIREATGPEEFTPSKAPLGPSAQRIATIASQIDRGRQDIRVYQNGQPVKLQPGFHQLIVANPADHHKELQNIAGKSVALVPSGKRAGRSDIYVRVGGVAPLCLAGNIFKVKQVLLATRENPIEVQIDGRTERLKPGQALLLM